MREILFRGKRMDNGEWVEDWYVHTKRHHCITTGCIDDGYVVHGYYASDVAMYVVDPATVGQYTGLRDKNGKRIFEGDILRWDAKEFGSEYCEKVEWDYGLLDLRKNDWHSCCEVIGNISTVRN